MCIGIPMRVVAFTAGLALCAGRGEMRQVETRLVDPVAVGDWLLVFLDSARERIDAARAAQVDATLDLLAQALAGAPLFGGDPAADPGFALPSAMDADQVAALAGAASSPSREGLMP